MTRAERRLRTLLVAHAIWSAVLACGYVASGDTDPFAFIANSFAKDILFVVLSAVAAANVRRHGWLALLIATGYFALVIGQIATLIWGGAPAQDVLGVHVSATVVLLVWMAVDLLLALLFAACWAAAVRSRGASVHLHPAALRKLLAAPGTLIPAERRLRGLLIAHAILSALLACGYVATGDTDPFAFIANSFAKDFLFVVVSAVGAADVRRFGWTALVVVAGYIALVVGQIATLIWGGAPAQDVLGVHVSSPVVLFGWMAIDLALAGWFAAWWAAAVRERHGLRYLNAVAFLGLVSVAEVMVEGRREVLSPEQTAKNVDSYLATLNARGKARVQLALIALAVWPLLTLRPPLPALAASTRKRFLERRFIEDVEAGRTFRPLRPLLQVMIRTGAQMSYLGYYGDRRVWPSIGYPPYRDRPDGRAAQRGDPPEPPLRSLTVPPRYGQRYDTLVIGSGAAGSILAYRFAQAGHC